MSPELAGLTEIAKLLAVTRRTAQRYADRADFPPPIDVLAGGRRIWRSVEVERWGRQHLPLPRPGRPPKRDEPA